IRPASMTSNGSISDLPPAARTLEAAWSALSTQTYVSHIAIGGAPSGIDPTNARDEVLALRLGRHHVLELPFEQAAVELDCGRGIRLAGVDPAGDAGDVSVALGHCSAPFSGLRLAAPYEVFRSGSVLNFEEDEIEMTETSGRLLELLSLLQARRDWPGGELADRLGVSGRTIRRDVERLRALGYPVDSLTGPAGGYRLRAGAAIPPLLLDDEEAIAIAVGLRTAARASVT